VARDFANHFAVLQNGEFILPVHRLQCILAGLQLHLANRGGFVDIVGSGVCAGGNLGGKNGRCQKKDC
jgi:hypothetical protein